MKMWLTKDMKKADAAYCLSIGDSKPILDEETGVWDSNDAAISVELYPFVPIKLKCGEMIQVKLVEK
jgi:hypothetical protein